MKRERRGELLRRSFCLPFASRARMSDCTRAMTDRRYDDDEVAEIFRKAAEGPQSLPTPSGERRGDDARRIPGDRTRGRAVAGGRGERREVDDGSAAGRRAEVYLDADRRRATIELQRRLTESEWEQLVVRLREVFNARGAVSSKWLLSSVDEWESAGTPGADRERPPSSFVDDEGGLPFFATRRRGHARIWRHHVDRRGDRRQPE